ncbi:MAG: helix-turn-helix domain-containing protein [Opitutaceae bacterium]
MFFSREFGTAEEFAEVLKAAGGEVVQTARGFGRWSAFQLALPSGGLIHCEAGAAVAGRGALEQGRICFLMPWRKDCPHFYRGVEMPDHGIAVYTEGAEHVGKAASASAWTLFVFNATRFLSLLSRLNPGADGVAPSSFTPLELRPHRRAKLERIVKDIAAASTDADQAAALTQPAILKTVENSILNTLGAEMADRAGASLTPGRLRHLSLSRVILKAWELARQLPSENLSLEDLCGATGVSARQVQNAFVQMTGIRPTAFLRAHRLQRARRMMLTGEAQSVKAAAYTCGFVDLGRFSAYYRQLFGEQPRATLARSGAN